MIRRYRSEDAAAVLALNADNVPEVGEMDADKLAFFAENAPYFEVVDLAAGPVSAGPGSDAAIGDTAAGDAVAGVVGMLIGLTEEQTAYPSANYGWFVSRYSSFAYVDRIALSPAGRGKGWGPELYRRFEAWAIESGRPLLCAEVNTLPDNPRSHRFHQLFGFAELERFRPYGPDEEVAMYAKELPGR